MSIGGIALSSFVISPVLWRSDWLWGLPLIVLTVVVHVMGLVFIKQIAVRIFDNMIGRKHPTAAFVSIMAGVTLLATCLHALEAGIWALAYRLVGALSDGKTAMLYSLNAITSYGYVNSFLVEHWQLLGAIEALNGWLLFGLTAAFLFAIVGKVWPGSL
jgi:hypothetical protein